MRFEMTAPVFSSVIVNYLIIIFLFGLCVIFISSGRYKLDIKDGKLVIKSILYNTSLSINNIDIDRVRIVNLEEETIKISVRTNGIGLPGLKVGWFSGNGNKYKLYLTDKRDVLLIPTKENYEILFSTKEGERIIKLIRENR